LKFFRQGLTKKNSGKKKMVPKMCTKNLMPGHVLENFLRTLMRVLNVFWKKLTIVYDFAFNPATVKKSFYPL